jgi:predicted transcriptional regulator
MADAELLSRREREIMAIVYQMARGATATDVIAAMADPPGRTAVRTFLRILEEKGHLRHTQRGREFVYHPIKPKRRVGRTALRRVLQTFYDGSLERAVAAHLSDPKSKLSTEELDELANLIEQARSQNR